MVCSKSRSEESTVTTPSAATWNWEKVGGIPGLRRRLVVEFGPPVVVARASGTSGKAALEQGNEQIRQALVAVVAHAVGRSGIALPVDDPNREGRP